MRNFAALGLLLAFVCAHACACGGNQAEPAAPSPPPAGDDAGPSSGGAAGASGASTAAAADGNASSATASTAADAGTGSAAPPPNSTTGTLPEAKDECTPVGVDFEKRARPKLKDCYAEGKKKDPNLEGTVKIKVTVDVKGKIKSVKVTEKTLPDAVANCMLKVVKATPFPEVDKCWDSTLTIPVTFPTPK